MPKVKNVGKGPRGFYDKNKQLVMLQPGIELEVDLDDNQAELIKRNPDYEFGGQVGGTASKRVKLAK